MVVYQGFMKCLICKLNFQQITGALGRRSLYCHKCVAKYTASQRWDIVNPEKRRASTISYRKNNIEICRRRTRENQIKLNNIIRFGGLREKILERDNFICQSCKKDISAKYQAVVHHKNHNKKDHRMKNLIALCHSCHAKHHWHGKVF